jgi:hypothetical protein
MGPEHRNFYVKETRLLGLILYKWTWIQVFGLCQWNQDRRPYFIQMEPRLWGLILHEWIQSSVLYKCNQDGGSCSKQTEPQYKTLFYTNGIRVQDFFLQKWDQGYMAMFCTNGTSTQDMVPFKWNPGYWALFYTHGSMI